MKSKVVLCFVLMLLCSISRAQNYSVSTNLISYAVLGTMNVDASYAVSRHWSIVGGVRFNPFTFRKGDPLRQFQYRQQSYSLGARLWPWHIWTGWWFSSKFRYQEYNIGGIIRPETREGDRVGLGLYAGYTHMLSSNFNIEFGMGLWGGMDFYKIYNCPLCGYREDGGRKVFCLPDDIMISLVYVF